MVHSAFFYGTLLHPKILKRVIGNDGTHLSICPAILLDHTRHRIKNCDYPGVVPYNTSKTLFDRELTQEERSVRGNLVTGLSEQDIDLLDIFEGNEYNRTKVLVHPLASLQSLNAPSINVVSTSAAPLPSSTELSEPVEANTYIWIVQLSDLEPELWSYEVFVKDSAWKWVDAGEDDTTDKYYTEVNRRQDLNGIIRKETVDVIEGLAN